MLVLALAILLASIVLIWYDRTFEVYDDRYIRNNHSPETKHEVSEQLKRIETKVHEFLSRAPQDCPRIQRIKRRWNGKLHETSSTDNPHDTLAYSVNKGEAIHVCVRSEDGTMSEENSILFVVFHELAHVAEDEYGHPPSFFETMTYLLELADHLGIYTYTDHDKVDVHVCNRKLGHNPYTCVKEGRCKSHLKR
jgi:hypothetical protein